LERKSKTEKREFLDPRVTNITPGRHKQKIVENTNNNKNEKIEIKRLWIKLWDP
jgi:hypothetical protein